MEKPSQPEQTQPFSQTETIPPYFHPETTLTNKSACASPVHNIQETRKLIFVFIIIELFLTLPIFVTTFYIFNPRLKALDGPSVDFLTSTFAFFGTIFLTIISVALSGVLSWIIHKRVKHLASSHDKTISILRITFVIVSSIPAILLILGFLHMITNY